jgi:hypothetical protein
VISMTLLRVIMPGEAGWFELWKAESGGMTGCAASRAAAQARLEQAIAARLAREAAGPAMEGP